MTKKIQKIIQQYWMHLLYVTDHQAYKKFYRFPFGKSPRATADEYMELWQEAKNKPYPVVDEVEKITSFAIDPDWLHHLARQTQVVIKKSEICYQHGRLLYAFLSQYIAKNNPQTVNILETGTARGFSALCMSKALFDRQKPGKILTLDVIPHTTKMYWNCIADLQKPMSRAQLLQDHRELIEKYIVFIQGNSKIQLPKIQLPRIHFAFLDGAHTYKHVMNEFHYIQAQQEKGDIVFFDDYTPQLFPGIVKAVNEICEKYNYAKEIICIDEQRGYVMSTKK